MLNNKILSNDLDRISPAALDQQLTSATLSPEPAANAGNYQHEQMKARRLRRQTRLSRQTSGKISGWTIGLW
jgi:hypothetical protein